MRARQFFISTLKEAPADAEVISQKLMLRAGMIRRLAAGIYTWMPMGLRVLAKVEAIIREEMNRAGALELLMPAVQPAELWSESGRGEHYGPELLRFKDRHDRDFVIGPTHEEVITDVVRREIKSYKQLPRHFYQIQTKFRDEIRPRFGVMRGREFIMKDGYSFHASFEDLQREYAVMFDTYARIFTRLGLKFRAVAADNGAIGGTGSHEFHVLADSGEDVIAYCPDSDYAANVELDEVRHAVTGDPSPDGKGTLELCRGIEVGHIFQLRTKYAEALKCNFINEQGQEQPMEMGCYGIGVTRIVGAAIEQGHDERGIIFPTAIAPFDLVIVPMGWNKSEAVRTAAEKLHDELINAGIDVMLDDRDERPGSMLADWELIGIPHRIVIGERGLKEGRVEYQHRRDSEATLVDLTDITAWVCQRLGG